MSNFEEKVSCSVLDRLHSEIEKVVSSKPHVIIAIDGNCGSGKTFYSSQLATLLNAEVIHCDHFFLPKAMRTSERLNEAGGNVHYERLREVLFKLKKEQSVVYGNGKEQFAYKAYNCSTDAYEQIILSLTNVVIVEGSYSLHKSLREFYDLKILLTVNEQTQRCRLLQREGELGLVNFVNKWIPLENRYFATLDTTDCIVIPTD